MRMLTNSDGTVEAVILAAGGVDVANGTRADTDDEDDGGVHVLHGDTEEGELLSDGGVVGCAGGVAALQCTGACCAGRRASLTKRL
jgi:hypothetical protein